MLFALQGLPPLLPLFFLLLFSKKKVGGMVSRLLVVERCEVIFFVCLFFLMVSKLSDSSGCLKGLDETGRASSTPMNLSYITIIIIIFF